VLALLVQTHQVLGVAQEQQVMVDQVQLHQLRVAVLPMRVAVVAALLIMLAIIRGVQHLVVVVLVQPTVEMERRELLIQAAAVVVAALKQMALLVDQV
jgi:hypothetical protein